MSEETKIVEEIQTEEEIKITNIKITDLHISVHSPTIKSTNGLAKIVSIEAFPKKTNTYDVVAEYIKFIPKKNAYKIKLTFRIRFDSKIDIYDQKTIDKIADELIMLHPADENSKEPYYTIIGRMIESVIMWFSQYKNVFES